MYSNDVFVCTGAHKAPAHVIKYNLVVVTTHVAVLLIIELPRSVVLSLSLSLSLSLVLCHAVTTEIKTIHQIKF